MSNWFKDFSLDFFGIKKLTKQIEELKKVVNEKVVEVKPYKSAKYGNGILTVVLHDGDIISKVCTVDKARELNGLFTEQEIRDNYAEKPAIAYTRPVTVPVIDEKEKVAKAKFAEHAEEVLDILGPDYVESEGEFFFNGINIPIPTILLNALVETKRQGLDTQYESFKNFWMWASLNPVESSRNDLFTFVRTNDVKLTQNGLLVLYRRIVKLNNKDSRAQTFEDFISTAYFDVKKSKKSPKHYSVFQNTDATYSKVSTDKVPAGTPVLGTLADLYLNLKDVETNVYTDNHTKRKRIQIGTVYQEAEDKIDLNNSIDCSNGLHVASKSYNYGSFGDQPVLCLVNPSKVRAVPTYSTGKMRVSEMFIACTLTTGEDGKYMDDDLDLVPFDEEYINISAEELERASKIGVDILSAVNTPSVVEKQAIQIVLDQLQIKKAVQSRVALID